MVYFYIFALCVLSFLPSAYSQVNTTVTSAYWVQTIIYSSSTIATSNTTIQSQFETSLMSAYSQAYTLQAYSSGSSTGRRKRLATSSLSNSLQLQLVSLTTNSSNLANYYLTYYVLWSSSPVAASTVCSTLNQLNVQQLALTLGYLIVQECVVYTQNSTSTTTVDAQYWVLGTCVGVICGAVFIVSLILIAKCACADSGCALDQKANSASVFAPKNSAIYIDELEALLIEEELLAEEKRKAADELMETMTTGPTYLGSTGKQSSAGGASTAAIATKVTTELKPQIDTMLESQKVSLQQAFEQEIRTGMRRLEKAQKKRLDEMSRTQRELIETSLSGINDEVFYAEPGESHVIVVQDGQPSRNGKRRKAAQKSQLEDTSVSPSKPDGTRDLELTELDQVQVHKTAAQLEASKPVDTSDELALQTQTQAVVEAEDVSKPETVTTPETEELSYSSPPTVDKQSEEESVKSNLQTNRLKRSNNVQVRFDSELRMPTSTGSYVRHLQETGRRPGGPLPNTVDAVDVATVGFAQERELNRTKPASLSGL